MACVVASTVPSVSHEQLRLRLLISCILGAVGCSGDDGSTEPSNAEIEHGRVEIIEACRTGSGRLQPDDLKFVGREGSTLLYRAKPGTVKNPDQDASYDLETGMVDCPATALS